MILRLPRLAARAVRDHLRERRFAKALGRYLRDPAAAITDEDLLGALVAGWGNQAWSGQSEYLRACVSRALRCDGPILECGSGLTTLLVGAVAQARGLPMWALEHLAPWGARVQSALDRHGIGSVRVCVAPLRSYGPFDWYAPPAEALASRFALVICDGPPAATRGGRYGLGAVMGPTLRADACILLDDAERSDEQRIAATWASELAMESQLLGQAKRYFVLERATRTPA